MIVFLIKLLMFLLLLLGAFSAGYYTGKGERK